MSGRSLIRRAALSPNLNAPFAFSINSDKGTVNFAFASTATVNSGATGTPPYAPLAAAL